MLHISAILHLEHDHKNRDTRIYTRMSALLLYFYGRFIQHSFYIQ